MANINVIESLTQPLRLADFGPPAGAGDAGPAMQAMIDYGYANGIASFDFGGREYDVDTTVDLPNPQNSTQANWVRRAVYNGNGAVFHVGSGVTCFRRTYADASSHAGSAWWNPAFRDMTFDNGGDGTGGAIDIWGAAACLFEGLTASSLATTFQTLFSLYAHYKNCVTVSCDLAFNVLSGDGVSGPNLTNGTRTNHNSNLVRFENCRCQMTDAAAIGFYIEGASQFSLQNCVTEGSDSDKCVVVNANTSLGWADNISGSFRNCWAEMTTSCNTVFDITVRKGTITWDNQQWGTGIGAATTGRLIDAGVSEFSVFKNVNTAWNPIQDDSMLEWFDQGSTAAATDNAWVFEDNILQSGNTLSDTAKWETVSGVPTNLTELRTFAYNA